jgi:OOP family OmpA-OmpF porin
MNRSPYPRLLATSAVLLSLGLTSVAQAQSLGLPGYVGLSGGRTTTDIDCAGALTCDRTDTAWKLFGGYLLHPNFGVEVDYRDQGKATLSGTVGNVTQSGSFTTESLGLYALATAREGALSGFAKLGLVATRARGTDSVAALATSGKETHTRPAVGLGMAWDFTERISARLEFERVRVKFGGAHRDVDLFSAGVQTRF